MAVAAENALLKQIDEEKLIAANGDAEPVELSEEGFHATDQLFASARASAGV